MHRALSPVLIGRETELGELEDKLLAASRGDASVVLVAWPAMSSRAARVGVPELAERGLVVEPVGLTLKGIDGETHAFRLPAPLEAATA